MVADQSQNPRTTPEAVARADLTNLWRGRLLSLDQVTENLFLAAFRSEANMMAIIRGQPWTLRNNNLLLEMYVQGRATRDYAFQFLEATVKLFGIPSMFRTEHHINAIINLIGHPSDWHRLNPRTFTADPYFVAVKVKLDATKSVLDKIFYQVPPVGNLGAIVIRVHYEKIKRICTFCAKLFHNAEQCPDRVQRIMAAGEDINFDQYGLWMTQLHRIPMQLVQTQLTSYQDILPGPSSALSELRQAFAGIRMGASLIMQTRGPNHSNAPPSAQLTTPVSSVPLHTAMVTTAEAMNVDKSSMLPLSNMMINPSDNMNLDNPAMLPLTTQPPTYAQQQSQQHQQSQTLQLNPHDQGHHSSMLQFNQLNIRQTQVRVQVEDHVWFEDRWMVTSLCDE
jgi:hypothetical protein